MPPDNEADPLSLLAPLFRVRPELQVLCRFGAQWTSPHRPEAEGWVPFHMVIEGTCMLDMDGLEPVVLRAGDVVLLPQGDAHTTRGLTTPADARNPSVLTTRTNGAIDIKTNASKPEAELICGRLTFEQPRDNLARAVLPRLIVLNTTGDASLARVGALLLAINQELQEARPGALAIASSLASALIVMVLRVHFQRGAAETGFLRLLGHRQTARAVTAMLGALGRNWSLDEIAAAANTSRATLVRDFRRLAGVSPLGFLTELRLRIARQLLSGSDHPLAEIAAQVGYASESAFSRAFRRYFQITPGRLRRQD